MDITQKDLILLFIGAVIGYLISWFFYKLPHQPLASYYLEETNEFYFESINGFKIKKYFKKEVNGYYKKKISEKEFQKVKNNLQRRVIDF